MRVIASSSCRNQIPEGRNKVVSRFSFFFFITHPFIPHFPFPEFEPRHRAALSVVDAVYGNGAGGEQGKQKKPRRYSMSLRDADAGNVVDKVKSSLTGKWGKGSLAALFAAATLWSSFY